MNKLQIEVAKGNILGDSQITEVISRFEDHELPWEHIVDDVIEKNGLQPYSRLIKIALRVLEDELARLLAKPPETRGGRILRFLFGWLKRK